jgi:hypothetical protein
MDSGIETNIVITLFDISSVGQHPAQFGVCT